MPSNCLRMSQKMITNAQHITPGLQSGHLDETDPGTWIGSRHLEGVNPGAWIGSMRLERANPGAWIAFQTENLELHFWQEAPNAMLLTNSYALKKMYNNTVANLNLKFNSNAWYELKRKLIFEWFLEIYTTNANEELPFLWTLKPFQTLN